MGNQASKHPSEWTDQDIEREILHLHSEIKSWAERLDVWYDCGFSSPLEKSRCEPSSLPVVTYFFSEWGIDRIICELEVEFSRLLEGMGYWFEQQDNVTLAIYTDDEERVAKFYEYFHWQWVCSLLVEDTDDVYEELYSHFVRHPNDLHKLHWRDFEILLFRIFQNHGYKTLLGPGRGDGGVDLRLWQENPLGDIMTVIQVKRYSPRNKIDLVPVQALYGVSKVEGENQAIFVTTSSYTPAARNFAARVPTEILLAEKEEVVAWCQKATNGVIKDKSTLMAREAVERLILSLAQYPDARIVHGTWGYDMCHNRYALVIKETRHAALLFSIGNRKISNDGYGTSGMEVPLLDATTINNFNESGVRRAVRYVHNDGGVSYWDGEQCYMPWDRGQNRFNYID
ncbi:restriction endonuclease [Xenophilus sp. AP218F]|nr:restriction endonuclease [Xenophilus sp. AP218F]